VKEKKAKSINACRRNVLCSSRHSSLLLCLSLQLCVYAWSSYSVNRLLNLLALNALQTVVVVRLMALCKERYTWSRARENERKKSKIKTLKSLLLDVSSESEIMYIFMHKMHWCNAFFFSFLQTLARVYTQTALLKWRRKKNAFVFYRLCAPLNRMDGYIIWERWMGSEKKKLKDSKSALAMSVSSLCRECVRRLHKFVQLAITAHSRTLYTFFFCSRFAFRGERR
jgi:hypothetical protein